MAKKNIKRVDHFSPLTPPETIYRPMLSGPATNQLTTTSTKATPFNINAITGTATLTTGSLKLFIEQYANLKGSLKVSTYKLLDALTMELTDQNHYRKSGSINTLVTLPLGEYMKICGIPDTTASKKWTRKKVKEELDILYNLSLEWQEAKGKETKGFIKRRICDSVGINRGKILFNFTPAMAEYLNNAYIMQYPIKLFKVDERNPNAYFIGKKLTEHHSIDNNIKRGTADIISVKCLLEICNDIPTYEEVIETDRHLERRIIKPFEKAIEALETLNIITWEYCNSKKVPLTDGQLENMDYSIFINLFIKFTALDAPDQTKRIKERTKEKEAASKKKASNTK